MRGGGFPSPCNWKSFLVDRKAFIFCVSPVSLSVLEWVLATKLGSPLALIFSDAGSEERGLFTSP